MSDNGESENFSPELSDDHQFSVSELIGLVEDESNGERCVPRLRFDNSSRSRGNGNQSSVAGTIQEFQSPQDLDEPICSVDPQIDAQNFQDPELQVLLENPVKRKRNLKADPSTWKREIHRAKRMKGEAYAGFYASSEDPKKLVFGKPRPAKVMGQRCRSNQCKKRSDMYCDDFSEDDRKALFQYFWKQLDWNQKSSYVSSLVDVIPVKRRRKESSMRRSTTNAYCLKLNDVRVRVCQRMFLSTLGLGLRQVTGWMKAANSVNRVPVQRKKRAPVVSEGTRCIHEFLDALPKLPSHYCRRNTSKLYLETHLTSKSQLLDLYKQHCKNNSLPECSRPHFFSILKTKNIGIFTPRKDECDLCVGYRNGQVNENEYNIHCQKKDLARESKSADKTDALEGKCHVLTMDLQAVKLSPVLNASALYYKTKLMSHNFTVYNLKTKDAVCYWWNETEGDLASSTFTSCIVDYIKTYLKDTLPVIIYSDGCTSQNRNNVLANALLELSLSSNRIILQKYLEKGHTQMECDSVHSVIETALKGKSIFVPSDYLEITRKARTAQPYIVREVDHTFFRDYSKKDSLRYASIRPGLKKGDACVTNIKNIKYLPEGKIQYKLSYEDNCWTDLPEKPKKIIGVSYPALFKRRKQITARKFKDLQDLKGVIPTEHHKFYDNIPHE